MNSTICGALFTLFVFSPFQQEFYFSKRLLIGLVIDRLEQVLFFFCGQVEIEGGGFFFAGWDIFQHDLVKFPAWKLRIDIVLDIGLLKGLEGAPFLLN